MPNAVIKYHKIETVDSAHPVFVNSIRIKVTELELELEHQKEEPRKPVSCLHKSVSVMQVNRLLRRASDINRPRLHCKRYFCVGSEFSGTIDASPADVGDLLRVPLGTISDIPADQKLTVFAPINSAFKGNDFAQDSATKSVVSCMQLLMSLCIAVKI